MRREVVDCDRCNQQALKEPVTVHIVVGESRDPIEGRTSDDTARVDLCATCAAWAFRQAVKQLPKDYGATLVSLIRQKWEGK